VLLDGAAQEEDAQSARLLAALKGQGTRVEHPSADLFRPGPRAVRELPELAKLLRGAP
jgi:hypothetical protein